jgi:hypothetical protein
MLCVANINFVVAVCLLSYARLCGLPVVVRVRLPLFWRGEHVTQCHVTNAMVHVTICCVLRCASYLLFVVKCNVKPVNPARCICIPTIYSGRGWGASWCGAASASTPSSMRSDAWRFSTSRRHITPIRMLFEHPSHPTDTIRPFNLTLPPYP